MPCCWTLPEKVALCDISPSDSLQMWPLKWWQAALLTEWIKCNCAWISIFIRFLMFNTQFVDDSHFTKCVLLFIWMWKKVSKALKNSVHCAKYILRITRLPLIADYIFMKLNNFLKINLSGPGLGAQTCNPI